MIRIAICDDSEYMRKATAKILLEYSIQKDMEYNVKQFETGEELLQVIDDYDLVFLDYQFEDKGKDGMAIAREIRLKNKDLVIIFLTSYTSIVFDSFEIGAYRFLIKPIDERKFYAAMDDYIDSLNKEQTLIIKVDGVTHYIKESKIMYVEGNGKKCIIHIIDGTSEIVCNETLSAIEQRLSTKLFNRCHKSFIVNMRYVKAFNHTDLVLENDESIVISRSKFKDFYEAYTDYISKI